MPRLRESFPRLQLYLREDQTARLLERLESGELDAVLLALPYALGDLEVMDLGEDRFSIVYPAGHVPAASLADENLLLLEDGHCLRDHALAACELEGARRNAGFNGTSLHTLAQMVGNGLGVTLMPQMALDAGILRGLDVTVRPLAGAVPNRRIGLVWRRSSARAETFRALGGALKAELAQS
jgi:LysR family hydrogen peroxide-inducible transcriptional activator